MMKRERWIVIVIAACVASCAGEPPPPRHAHVARAQLRVIKHHEKRTAMAAKTEHTPPPLVALCMAAVPEVQAEVSPLDGGIGVVLSATEPEHRAALRKRAHEMSGKGTQYEIGDKDVAVDVAAQDIDSGVFVMFAAKKPAEASALATKIREDAEELVSGRCSTGEEIITTRE